MRDRDDACISEKELGSNNSINTPIPGLVIKTQFQKDSEKNKNYLESVAKKVSQYQQIGSKHSRPANKSFWNNEIKLHNWR